MSMVLVSIIPRALLCTTPARLFAFVLLDTVAATVRGKVCRVTIILWLLLRRFVCVHLNVLSTTVSVKDGTR